MWRFVKSRELFTYFRSGGEMGLLNGGKEGKTAILDWGSLAAVSAL